LGLSDSLQHLNELLIDHWDALYPFEDEDDPDDPWYERINLIRELSEDPAFIDNLRRAPLFTVRGIGTYSIRDLDIAAGVLPADSDEDAHCQDGLVRGAIAELGADGSEPITAALTRCGEFLGELTQYLETQVGSSGPDLLASLSKCTAEAIERWKNFAGDKATTVVPDADRATADAVAVSKTANDSSKQLEAVTSYVTSIHSRDEAKQAFDRIIRYYREVEPASPVAVFAERARDLISKNFFDVLTDLAPGGDTDLASCLELLNGAPLKYLLAESFSRHRSAGQQSVDTSIPEGIEMLNSRDAVVQELNSIEGYFLMLEPASPIPLLIAEMRRLIPKSFSELLSEFTQAAQNLTVSEVS